MPTNIKNTDALDILEQSIELISDQTRITVSKIIIINVVINFLKFPTSAYMVSSNSEL